MSGLLRTPAPAGGAGVPAPPIEGSVDAAAVATDFAGHAPRGLLRAGRLCRGRWGAFVTDPPVGRMLLVLAVATGGAAALGALGRAPIPRPAVHVAAAVIAVVMVALGLMAAGLPGRLLSGALGGAVRGARPRPRGSADRGLALRRRGSVDPAHRAARGACPAHGRSRAGVLARAPRDPRAPSGRALCAAAHVRHGGGGARSRPAGPARAGPARSPRRLAVASAAPAPRSRSGRCGGGKRRGSLATCRGRARHQPRVVGLPRGEVVREGQGHHVRLEPHLRPAELVARGRDALEREVGPPAVLEGGDARRLRRLPLDPHERPERHAVRHAGRLHGAPDRGKVGLRGVQPRLGQAHPRDGAIAVHAVRDRRRRDPEGRRRERAHHGRRHDQGGRLRPAQEGRHLFGARLRAEPDAKGNAGVAQGVLRQPGAVYRDHAPAPRRVRSRRARGRHVRTRERSAESRVDLRPASLQRPNRTGGRAPTGCSAAPLRADVHAGAGSWLATPPRPTTR